MSTPRTLAAGVLLAMAGFAVAIALQIGRDRVYPRAAAQERALLYVRSPAALRRIVLSFDGIAADVYWIRALQHYGGTRVSRAGERKYELLYPLLFTQSDEVRTLPLALLSFQGEFNTNYPVLFSGILVAAAPVVVLYVFLQRYFIAGMTAGADKG